MDSAVPLVSVIVLNWNRVEDLKETLQNVVAQDYINFEVIVVDNASTDGSQEMVEKEFPKFRLIKNEQNLGCVSGFNVGIRNAKGDFIVLLDNDAFFEDTNALTKISHAFEQDPLIGIVTPKVLNYFSKEIENVRMEQDFINCAVGIRRQVFERVGLFPEMFFIYANEQDFAIRARNAGYSISFRPDITAFHKTAPTQRSSEFSFYVKVRNIFWVIWRNYPLSTAISKSVRHLILSAFFAGKKHMTRAYRRAVYDAIKQARIVLIEREPVKRGQLCVFYPEPFFPWLFRTLVRKCKQRRRDLGRATDGQ